MNKTIRNNFLLIFFSYLLVVWSIYRFVFNLPIWVDELVVKPLLWLGPIAYFVFLVEKKSLAWLGITKKNLIPAVYFALILGVVFALEALLVNIVKYGGFAQIQANFGNSPFVIALGFSLVTAVVEEITFRGYIFYSLWRETGREWISNFVSSFGWALIHIPVNLFILRLTVGTTFANVFLVFIFGVGSAFVFARTKNVSSSILLHILWQWPIIMFR